MRISRRRAPKSAPSSPSVSRDTVFGALLGLVLGLSFVLLFARWNRRIDRSPADLAVLARRGTQIQVMSLHSYLFFGSASGLHQHVKALLARRPECRFLVFDFRLVTGVDASATHSLPRSNRRQTSGGRGSHLQI